MATDEVRMERLKARIARWEKLTPEERDRRMRVWQHNGLLGSVAMARVGMQNVQRVTTTSARAKDLALEVEGLLELLGAELKAVRIDE